MTGVNSSPTWTQSDATAEAVSRHNVLLTSPQHYREKISRYLESSAGQSRQDEVPNGLAEGDSDSGDSLFITQKPVPEAVRSGRRPRGSSKSSLAAPRDHGESGEDGSSSSSSPGEPKTAKERKRKKYTLPEYSFPFLTDRKRKHRRSLLPVQNITLHRCVMAGFFTCVRELQQGRQTAEERRASLPTVDSDGESIPPLSEEEEERPEDADIRVVERKHLVAPSKAKSQQTWCSLVKPQKKKAADTRQETTRGRQTEVGNKTPAQAVPAERTDGHETETPKTTRRLSRGNKKVILQREEALRSPRKSARRGRQKSAAGTEPPGEDVLQTGPAGDAPEGLKLPNNHDDDHVCSETKVKKRKKKNKDKGDDESVEKGMDQSPKGADAATGVNVEVEESEENRAERPGSDEGALMENVSHYDALLREEERDSNQKKKKKRRKEKSATENHEQEAGGNLESDVREEDCDVQDGGEEKKKKKKKKRKRSEQLESDAVVELLNAEIHKKKKKKRKKEETEEGEEEEAASVTLSSLSAEPVSESGNSLETSESHVKRKKHKKKQQSLFNEATQDGEESVDLNFCIDDSVTSAKGSAKTLKRKKKTIFEGWDVFNTPEKIYENMDKNQETKEDTEGQNAEVVSKKKKKKKSEISSRSISEDSVAQSDDSVSVREKEKKRSSSFLAADAEENSAQTQPAENPGGLEEVNKEVTTKKKKRKKKSEVQDGVGKDPGQEFEESNQTCLTETTDTGVKKKKKRAGNESETSTERLESAADVGLCPAGEAVVLKKKKKKKKSKDQVMTQEKGERCEEVTEETVNMAEHTSDTSGPALNDIRDKKKKKKKPEIH